MLEFTRISELEMQAVVVWVWKARNGGFECGHLLIRVSMTTTQWFKSRNGGAMVLAETLTEVSFNVLLWKLPTYTKQREGYNKPPRIHHWSSTIINSRPIFLSLEANPDTPSLYLYICQNASVKKKKLFKKYIFMLNYYS